MFSTPALVLWDSLRILAAVAALFVVGVTPFILLRTLSWHQRIRFVASAIVAAAIVGGYLQSLGTVPDQWGWRTVLITLGMIGFAVGCLAYLQDQLPEPARRHRR